MIRVEGIRLKPDEHASLLPDKTAGLLRITKQQIRAFRLVKKAVDARNKRRIHFICSVEFKHPEENTLLNNKRLPKGIRIKSTAPYLFHIPQKPEMPLKHPPVIVGTGPCGLFAALVLAKAGLNPILIERGKPVEDRVGDVDTFRQGGALNPDSNIQFGEGGAGTFSDGKLYTLINDARTQFIFDQLIRFGAPPEIAWDARPHIGTDKLRSVIPNMRREIMQLGGEFHFNTTVTAIRTTNGNIEAVQLNKKEWLSADRLILAIGHSARDTYQMLYDSGLTFTQKPFAIGVRIEHLKEWIQRAQYGDSWDHPALPSAKYKLVAHLPTGRSVYTFCMCPGGTVVPAASEPGRLVTNGMSEYAQNRDNSNSALLVSVKPGDYLSDHPLAGIEFQRQWEAAAFNLTDRAYHAPVQLVSNFIQGTPSPEFRDVRASYQPGISFQRLDACLPDFVSRSLKDALPILDRKLKGFAHPDAVLTGVETRSSASVRMVRNEDLESSIKGIYPAGEGAGYAGGIVSAALDGIRIAEKILDKT